MWQVKIHPHAYRMVSDYLRAYRDVFLERFTDTGIWSEEVICQGYRDMTDRLGDDIMLILQEKITATQIIGYKEEQGMLYVRYTI